MASARWVAYAGGVVLFLAAGCTIPDFLGLNLMQQTGPGGDRVVAGSLESVSLSTQSTLRQLGLSVLATQDGEAIRIASKTRMGDSFDLVLTRVKTDQGEQTQVHLEWKSRADEQTGAQILGQVEAQQSRHIAGAQK